MVIKYLPIKWNKILFLLLFFFNIVCISNTQETNDENENIIINVLFFNYVDEGIHFTITGENGTRDEWRDTVDMKVISNEYKNLIFQIIIGEYPVREQLRGSNVYIIKINKYYLEEYLFSHGNNHIYSSSIKFLE